MAITFSNPDAVITPAFFDTLDDVKSVLGEAKTKGFSTGNWNIHDGAPGRAATSYYIRNLGHVFYAHNEHSGAARVISAKGDKPAWGFRNKGVTMVMAGLSMWGCPWTSSQEDVDPDGTLTRLEYQAADSFDPQSIKIWMLVGIPNLMKAGLL